MKTRYLHFSMAMLVLLALAGGARPSAGQTVPDAMALAAPGWSSPLPTVVDSAGDVGQYLSLAIVAGHPAISYFDATNGDLKYVRALDSTGSAWGSPVIIDSSVNFGRSDLEIIGGRPAIAYFSSQPWSLRYARALDDTGLSWAPSITIAANSTSGWPSLTTVSGRPAIAYGDTATHLVYIRALNGEGDSWGAAVAADTAADVAYTSMVVVDGFPAVAYYEQTNSDLRYVRAADTDGASWTPPVTLESNGMTGLWPSLAVVAGNPAIAYSNVSSPSFKYIRALDTVGASWGAALVLDGNRYGMWASMAIVNAMPAISYYETAYYNVRFVRSWDGEGMSWRQPQAIDTVGVVDHGIPTSLAIVDGQPGIAYYRGGDADLLYVRADNPSGTKMASTPGLYIGQSGVPIDLDGSLSTGSIIEYAWDCTDDGAYDVTSPSPTGSACTYPTEGRYTVRLRVTNTRAQTDEDTADVIVSTSGSATFTVNTTDDVNPPNTCDAKATGTECSLREAIIAANRHPGRDTVVLSPGVIYKLTIAGADEDAGESGDLDITDSVVIDGEGNGTAIDASQLLDRVFDVMPQATEVEVSRLVVTGGQTHDNGGGIRNFAKLLLTDIVVTDNTTTDDGGGLYNAGDATLIVMGGLIRGNRANDSGGGLHNAGKLVITNSDISDNRAGDRGGGIMNSDSGTTEIVSTKVSNNRADGAGGIGNSGRVELTNCIISENRAREWHGGGIWNISGVLRLTNSTIAGNTSEMGGGIHNEGGYVLLTNSSVHHNHADQNGGGINSIQFAGSPGHTALENSTVGYNTAGRRGGGFNNGGALRVNNSTVAYNSAAEPGGGIANNGSARLTQTILAENEAPSSPNCDTGGSAFSEGYNLFGNLQGCQLQLASTDIRCTAGSGVQCPGLGDFADDGRAGRAHFPLRTGSVAVDAGNPNPTSQPPPCTFTDQLGNPRTDGNGDGQVVCDIGAIEIPPYYDGGENFLRLDKWYFSSGDGATGKKKNGGVLTIDVRQGPVRACWHQDLDGGFLAGKAVRYEAAMRKSTEMRGLKGWVNPYVSLQVQRGDGTWQYNFGGAANSRAQPGGQEWVGESVDVILPADMKQLRASFCVYDASPGLAEARALLLRLATEPPPPPPPPAIGRNLLSENWTWAPATPGIHGHRHDRTLIVDVWQSGAHGCWAQDLSGLLLRGTTVLYEASMAKLGVLDGVNPQKPFMNPYISLQVQTSDGVWHYNHGGVIHSHAVSGGDFLMEGRPIALPPDLMTLRAAFCVWQAEPGTGLAIDVSLREINIQLAQGEESAYPTWEEYMPDTPSAMEEDMAEVEMPEIADFAGLLYLPLMQR